MTELEKEMLAALKAALSSLHRHNGSKKVLADQMRAVIAKVER